jgi:Zn-finger nucleic acid-binding protein
LEIDSCFYCYGLWFDFNELRRFFTAPKLYNKFRLPQHKFKVKIKSHPSFGCVHAARTQSWSEQTIGEVVVDECPGCKGIWLDCGEISRLIELYESGKLKG